MIIAKVESFIFLGLILINLRIKQINFYYLKIKMLINSFPAGKDDRGML